jgi:hypothetical protein
VQGNDRPRRAPPSATIESIQEAIKLLSPTSNQTPGTAQPTQP